ncbi:hypothetical protein KCU92_g9855, partial [Aureobasidium melanogenum]
LTVATLAQTTRLKDGTGRISTDAEDALVWLDDAPIATSHGRSQRRKQGRIRSRPKIVCPRKRDGRDARESSLSGPLSRPTFLGLNNEKQGRQNNGSGGLRQLVNWSQRLPQALNTSTLHVTARVCRSGYLYPKVLEQQPKLLSLHILWSPTSLWIGIRPRCSIMTTRIGRTASAIHKQRQAPHETELRRLRRPLLALT